MASVTVCSKRFILVRNNSTLELRITSDDTSRFVASAKATWPDGSIAKCWTHAQLVSSSPAKLKLKSGDRRYLVVVDVAFTSTSVGEAKLRVEVLKPDGATTHSKPWFCALRGKRPSIKDTEITILMKSP